MPEGKKSTLRKIKVFNRLSAWLENFSPKLDTSLSIQALLTELSGETPEIF